MFLWLISFQGGTSDTGNNARKFFSAEKRDAVIALGKPRDEGEEENYRRLLQFDNVVYRVANSTRKIHVPNFKKYVQDGTIFQLLAFYYAPFSKTATRMYSHVAGAMEKNKNRGLGQQSEG